MSALEERKCCISYKVEFDILVCGIILASHFYPVLSFVTLEDLLFQWWLGRNGNIFTNMWESILAYVR